MLHEAKRANETRMVGLPKGLSEALLVLKNKTEAWAASHSRQHTASSMTAGEFSDRGGGLWKHERW
jgi:hypothetical protein